MRDAMQGCEVVFHQAAHKAVLRSVEHPLITDTVNTHGTLTVLKAALDAGVRRVVHASSSSVYGGAAPLPTTRDARRRGPARRTRCRSSRPRSTAACSPSCTASRRSRCATSTCTAPRQRPDATYAAVIPLFVDALLNGERPGRARRRAAVTRLHVHLRRRRREPRGRARARRARARATCTTSPAGSVVVAARHPRACSATCSASSRTRSSSSPAPATCATARPTRAPPPATSASTPRSRSPTASRTTVDWLTHARLELARVTSPAAGSSRDGRVMQRGEVLVERQDQRGRALARAASACNAWM